ncbi:hypothetical protein ACCAA_370049 [Candidatus Accumulibacter aalborgensis]|uniref:Uncharacterized protein n=1 Tax=Candidatus Accumulibacter aalborgensis TaxID=1860102 RepID=A0A1A8XP85_9PROT|nr:hypothetical protein ACCAA_370049 [Candidatus Accumulibacter aalborgensis]
MVLNVVAKSTLANKAVEAHGHLAHRRHSPASGIFIAIMISPWVTKALAVRGTPLPRLPAP